MNITLRQLRAFVAVAEHKQFTAAAEQVHLSQAALSMQIRGLEEELGFKLFDRHTRMVRLTNQGMELLSTAHRVLEEIDNTVRHSHEYLRYQRGQVKVAAGTVLSSGLLVPLIKSFILEYPDIEVQLVDTSEQELLHRLQRENIDFAVGTSSEEHGELLETPLFIDNYQLLIDSEHELNKLSKISWKKINQYPFIALFPDSPIRKDIEAHFARQMIKPKKIFEVSFHTTVLSMVRNSLGIAVLPSNSRLLPEANGIVYRQLNGPQLERETCLFELRYRSLSPAAELFKRKLLQHSIAYEKSLQN